MRKILRTLILGVGFTLVASVAMAQPQCSERDNVLESLAKKYKETTTAAGVTNTGGLVEVLVNPKSSTWTIIVTTPQGMSCLVAAGEGWRNMEQKLINTDPEA